MANSDGVELETDESLLYDFLCTKNKPKQTAVGYDNSWIGDGGVCGLAGGERQGGRAACKPVKSSGDVGVVHPRRIAGPAARSSSP